MAVTDTANPDWDGYGDNWDTLRAKALELDDYTCQRCFRNNGPLQAHHVKPRSQGGEDHINNLITLCRPCHGVQHPDNGVFDDSRPDAPLFPDPAAPEPVAWLRQPAHHDCDRCDSVSNDPIDIIALRTDDHALYTLCQPCAGVIATQRPNAKHHLSAQDKLRLSALTDVADQAQLHPDRDAPTAVRVSRTPQAAWERLAVTVPFWEFVWRALFIILVVGFYAAILL